MFVDLGASPLANSYLTAEQTREAEAFFPLKPHVCGHCFLVQLPVMETPDRIFTDYAYFSSFTDSWVRHAKAYTETVVERFNLGRTSFVVEVASNDGYLLQHFVARGIPALGIEPAANVAVAAEKKGIPTRVAFFGTVLARELASQRRADLIVANNVLAHVPALNDFVAAIEVLLAPNGVATLEFPHLMRLMEENQFDTIYHEHYSYFSFATVQSVFAAHGLRIFDVEELPTHGGSLRIFACRTRDDRRDDGAAVTELLARERAAGMETLTAYASFAEQRQGNQAAAAHVPHRCEATRHVGRRLRRARQGQHASELLRHPHRFSRLHRRSQSPQTGPLSAGDSHPHLRPGEAGGDKAGIRAHPPVECEGGDRRVDGMRARLGWPVCRADPERESPLE